LRLLTTTVAIVAKLVANPDTKDEVDDFLAGAARDRDGRRARLEGHGVTADP
jgi:hypothetical protein